MMSSAVMWKVVPVSHKPGDRVMESSKQSAQSATWFNGYSKI